MRFIAGLLLGLGMILGGAWLLGMGPSWLLRSTLPLRFEEFIVTHADNHGLEPALLAAMINVESGFDPDAESSAGAIGLMQLTPSTGQGIADRTGGARWTVEDLHDPELNIRYGSWYIAHLLERFAGEEDPTLVALAAYNAGQGNVIEWIEAGGGTLELDGIPFPETRSYVVQVRDLTRRYREAFPDLAREPDAPPP